MKSTEITKEELSAVKYSDLKAKFAELGIESIWQNGVKKDLLIASALEKLSEIKEKAIAAGDIEKDPELTNVKLEDSEEDKKAAILKEAQDKEEEEKAIADKAVKDIEVDIEEVETPKVISKEILEKNIKLIETNLRNGIPAQKSILQKKLQELQELLDQAE